jgi:hypothetical protein
MTNAVSSCCRSYPLCCGITRSTTTWIAFGPAMRANKLDARTDRGRMPTQTHRARSAASAVSRGRSAVGLARLYFVRSRKLLASCVCVCGRVSRCSKPYCVCVCVCVCVGVPSVLSAECCVSCVVSATCTRSTPRHRCTRHARETDPRPGTPRHRSPACPGAAFHSETREKNAIALYWRIVIRLHQYLVEIGRCQMETRCNKQYL